MNSTQKIIISVLFCHFLASFTALGMPLFLPKVMADLLDRNQQFFIGWYYILPTICMALAAPWWGRFADNYGKRLSLLRAQLGLAAGFMIAGLADNLIVFTLGLLIQGICGGTFAASNAYLATQVSSRALPKVLNWTQFSARLSLLLAPIAFGLLMTSENPRTLYCYLALLPLLAAWMVALLPADNGLNPAKNETRKARSEPMGDAPLSFVQILTVQFLFCFAMVVSFPYFLPYAHHLGVDDSGMIGWYFSLPHLVYLVVTALPQRWQQNLSAVHLCALGLATLMVSALIHTQLTDSSWLWLARLTMGLGITLSFMALHQCFAALKASNQAGLVFGRFDSAGKWAGVCAGLSAGLIVEFDGLGAPFILSATAGALALIVIYLPMALNRLNKSRCQTPNRLSS